MEQMDIANLYQAEDWQSVNEYIGQNGVLLPILAEGFSRIQGIFGGGTVVTLTLVTEPSSGSKELFALIATSLSVEAATAKLQEFDETWWIDVPERALGLVCFDIEF